LIRENNNFAENWNFEVGLISAARTG